MKKQTGNIHRRFLIRCTRDCIEMFRTYVLIDIIIVLSNHSLSFSKMLKVSRLEMLKLVNKSGNERYVSYVNNCGECL